MNAYIDSYAMFFTVFISMFVLALILDWLSRKYNLKLRNWFGQGGSFFSDPACSQDTGELQERVAKLETEVSSLLGQHKV